MTVKLVNIEIMRGLKNFIVGTISTLGVSQTLLAAEHSSGFHSEIICSLNTVVSIIGGILSTATVAYLQHKWRMKEDDRRWKHEEEKEKNEA